MTVKIGTTTITVTECYAYRYQNGKLVLKITLPKTEIGHDDLFNLVKNNTADVVLTNDDASTETFSGYSYTLTILTNDTEYQVEVECVSETERKIGILNLLANATASDFAENEVDVSQCLDEIATMIFELDERLTALEEQ